MPISKIKSSAIDPNAITGSAIADGTVTSADLDTNIEIAGTLDVTGTLTADAAGSVAGNFGIGTTSPGQKLEVNSGNSTVGMRVRRFAGSYYSDIVHTDSPEGLAFKVGDGSSVTERLRILGTGGITFNGDTAVANALDDYEEGEFAYTMPFSTSGSMTVRANYQKGYYVKVGRLVTIHLRFETQGNSGSLSGDLRIDGLPYTVANVVPTGGNVSYVYPIHLRGVSSTSFDYDLSFYFLPNPGTTYGTLYGQGEGSSHAQTAISSSHIPSNVEGTLAFTYLVNA